MKVRTECKLCTFAKLTPDSDGVLEQVGCELGRLEKFRKLGVPLTVEGTHFVIEGRICRAARVWPWGEGLSLEERKRKVRGEIKIGCDAFVYAGEEANTEEVSRTLDSLSIQQLPFRAVHVINNSEMRRGQLRLLMREYNDRLRWWLRTTIKDEKGVLPEKYEALDRLVVFCESPFYALFNAGFEVPENFLLKVDQALNDDLLTFVALEGDEHDNGAVVMMKAHKDLGGNQEMVLMEVNSELDTPLPDAKPVFVKGVVNKVKHAIQRAGGEMKRAKEFCPSL